MYESQVDQRLHELSFGPFENMRHFKFYYVDGYKFRVRGSEEQRVTFHTGVCIRAMSMMGRNQTAMQP